MARRRSLVAVLAISCAVIACEKKDKPAAKGAQADDGSAQKAEADKPSPAANKDDLALIPLDSEAVLGVNWGQLQSSPLWKDIVEPQLLKDSDFVEYVAEFKQRCGFDPMTSVKKLSIGMKNLDGRDMPDGVMVVHGPEKAKTMACAEKWSADAAKEKVTIKTDGDVVTLIDDTNAGIGVTFIGERRMLVVVGKGVDAAAVRTAAEATSTLSTSPAFVDMFGKISKTDSAWFLFNGNSKLFEEASAMGLRPKAVFGSFNVTQGVSADVRARLDSPEQATQTVNSLKGTLSSMASMLDTLDLTSDGADMKLVAAASKEKLQNIIKFAAAGGM